MTTAIKKRGKRMPKTARAPKRSSATMTEVRAVKQAKRDADTKRLDDAIANVALNDPRLIELAFERIRRDPGWWFKDFAYTADPHDDTNRIKLFPWDKPFFQIILDTILRDKVVIIAKSRQMMMSWLLSGLNLWKGLAFDRSECYVQCTNEDTVDYFVQTRIQTIYDHLPDWQKIAGPSPFKYCGMSINGNGSFVRGLPAGSDKARGRVPSIFDADELAFQEKGMQAVSAVLPAIAGDALFMAVSTPNMKNHFWRMCFPESLEHIETIYPIPESPKTKIERYKGHTVIFLHYTADPDKRSKEWYDNERARFFAQGFSEEAWQQEYELNFDVSGNPALYPHFDATIHAKDVKYDPTLPLIIGLDFGYHTPAAAYMQLNKNKTQIRVLWGMQGKDIEIEEFMDWVLRVRDEKFPPGVDQSGRKLKIPNRWHCDHSGTQQTQLGNVVKILRSQYDINPMSEYSKPEERATLVSHWLRVRKDTGEPGMVVNQNCPEFMEGFLGGFCSKPDKRGYATGIPFKDGDYDDLHDAFTYPVQNTVGVRRKPVTDREKMQRMMDERRRKRKAQYQYNSTGYGLAHTG